MLKNQSAASETVGSCSTTVEPWNPHQFQNIQQILEEGDGGPRIYPLHLLWSDTLFCTGAVQAVFQAGQVKKKHKSCWYIPSSTTRLVLARILQNIWLWLKLADIPQRNHEKVYMLTLALGQKLHSIIILKKKQLFKHIYLHNRVHCGGVLNDFALQQGVHCSVPIGYWYILCWY